MDLNARQLEGLDFNYLDQSETYQYNENQLQRAKGSAAIVAKLQEFITPWEQAKQRFDDCYRQMSTTGQTKTNEMLDSERDSLTTGFKGSVSNARKSPIAAQAQAAEEVYEVVERYNINTSGEYEQQTMRTDQMCTDLLTNYQTQLTTLGLTAWVEALQAKNQEFNAAMIARTNAQAGYVHGELSLLRQQLIAAYRNFVKMLNAVLLYEGDTAYATVVDQMNAEIRHYKQIIARKRGGGSSSGTTNSGNSGTTEPTDPGTTTDPENPGTTTDPENPGTTDPENPGTTDPTDPGTGGGGSNDNPGGGSGGGSSEVEEG